MGWQSSRRVRKERERARERGRQRARRRSRPYRKRVANPLDPMTYLNMGRRQAERELNKLRRPVRNRIRREMRRLRYRMRKKVFGQCEICGKAGGPGHTCRQRVNAYNAEKLRKRLEKQGKLPKKP